MEGDEGCRRCKKPFKKKAKGWKRLSCKLLFPAREGFYCIACFNNLKKSISTNVTSPRRPWTPGTPAAKRFRGTPSSSAGTSHPLRVPALALVHVRTFHVYNKHHKLKLWSKECSPLERNHGNIT
jgi:hypothetical protein